jgi:hypothetical protein
VTLRRATTVVMMLMSAAAAACGGSTPTSPNRACEPVTGTAERTLAANDLFRFQFTVPPRPETDLVAVFIGENASGLEQSGTTIRLYDGANLLGSVSDYQDSVVFWKSTTSQFGTPSSPYWFSAPAMAIDFRSIVNGTIDGRVEFLVTRGSVHVERLDLATLVPVSLTDPTGFGTPASVSVREICR